MKYIVQARVNPQNKTAEPSFYLQAKMLGNIDLAKICEEISISSSLTRGDVTNAIMSFLDTIPKYLKMGYSVNMGEMGTLRLSIKSEGSATPEEVNAGKIRNIRAIFVAGSKLKKEIAGTPVELFPAK